MPKPRSRPPDRAAAPAAKATLNQSPNAIHVGIQRYFRSPSYRARVERTFGPAVLHEIDAMSAHRLQRRFAG